jgi:pimeloyl-ACP methyl ester carboxylesterase
MRPDPAAPGAVIVAGGRQVHVVDSRGDGPPVLLLGGCGVPWYVWDRVAELLADHRVVRLDRPGLVATAWPGRLPTLAEEVATLAELIDRLPAAPVIAAHSMAGFHAEALVRLHPDRAAALVLVDGSIGGHAMSPAQSRRWQRRAETVRRVMVTVPASRALGSLADRTLSSLQSRVLGLTSARPPAQREVFRRPDAVAAVLAEQAAYHTQVADLDAVRRMAPWPGVPVTVLTAAGDGGRSWPRLQAELAERLGAEHVTVADAKHLLMVDRPDVVADAVRARTRAD